jgi:multisubunit Na+/H+ antiporter MnhC subunit
MGPQGSEPPGRARDPRAEPRERQQDREDQAQRDARDETQDQRDDRNLAELLQELRVAGLGVQVLFGFLLSLPFTSRFARLSSGQRDLYLASLLLSATATALLLGPVAYHRLVFRRGQKERLVRAASTMAILGLGVVGLAVSAAVLLVSSYVVSALPAALITAFIVIMFGGLWFAFPIARRQEQHSRDQDSRDAAGE